MAILWRGQIDLAIQTQCQVLVTLQPNAAATVAAVAPAWFYCGKFSGT